MRPKERLVQDTAAEIGECVFSGDGPVHDRHERVRHPDRVGVLDDVAAVNDPGGAVLEDGLRAAEDLLVGRAPASADEHRHAACRFDGAAVLVEIVGRVGLDHVRPQLDGLTDEGDDRVRIPLTP